MVEQLVHQQCPSISEQFLPDLLAKLKENDVCCSMLLGKELNDQDLRDMGRSTVPMSGLYCWPSRIRLCMHSISSSGRSELHGRLVRQSQRCPSKAGIQQLGVRKKFLKAFGASAAPAAAPGGNLGHCCFSCFLHGRLCN